MKIFTLAALCGVVMLSHNLSTRAEGLPDLGDISRDSLTPLQERQIGEQSMFEIRADKSFLEDAEVNDYINNIGYQLVSNSNEPSQEFEFFTLDNNSINAFALPGGFIGVNTGLILAAQSESELASVLSHEIAHVTQHHIARMIAGQKFDSLTTMAAIAIAILAARNSPDAAQTAIIGAQAGAIQRQLNFTRTHELEADRLGLITLQKAGFDPRAMPAFFERLQKATSLLDNNMPSYLRTHPVTSERIADTASRVQHIPFRFYSDSLNFHLVRAKLRAMQKNTRDAIAYFTGALGDQKHGNQIAQNYGLAMALLNNGQTSQAAREFSPLQKYTTQNPMIATLAGAISKAQKHKSATIGFYRSATQNFPQHLALFYDYAELLLQDQSYHEALNILQLQILKHPNDAHLYELQARTYAALGKQQEKHHALAYHYKLRGNLFGAIEQLELAKNAGKDYFNLSAIESELKRLKTIAEARHNR